MKRPKTLTDVVPSVISAFLGAMMIGLAYVQMLKISKNLKYLPKDLDFHLSQITFVYFYPLTDLLFGVYFLRLVFQLYRGNEKAESRGLNALSIFLILYCILGINTLETMVPIGLLLASTLIVMLIYRSLRREGRAN